MRRSERSIRLQDERLNTHCPENEHVSPILFAVTNLAMRTLTVYKNANKWSFHAGLTANKTNCRCEFM